MKRYVICDKRADFLHDVKMRALLDECECLITEISDGAKYRDLEDTLSGQIVVICENMLDELPEGFEHGLSASQVMGYCLTREGQGQFASRKIPCLGLISSSSQILSMLLGMPGERADHLPPVSIQERVGEREERPAGEDQDFLQKKEDTGLYALLAPQSHTASLDITSEELQIIMRNLRENAGMDYIIYDTGNDLKDTTLLALEQAEYALLVVTQDISCAHCLDMLIRTLEAIKFDSSKIRLVINDVMSAKATGISVAELTESFSYPCWAKIKHDPSIIRCNNFGKPVVFSASHDMTKQMRNVIRHLNEKGGKLQAEEPRKGLWKRMFSGRKYKCHC